MIDKKFKGERIDNGELIYGGLILSPNSNRTLISYFEIIDEGENCEAIIIHYDEVDPETVSQYTGLKDKDGKEIYEGDIISISTSNEGIIKKPVIFKDGCFGVDPWFSFEWSLVPLWLPPSEKHEKDLEVIGNIHIHKNTELKEVER